MVIFENMISKNMFLLLTKPVASTRGFGLYNPLYNQYYSKKT